MNYFKFKQIFLLLAISGTFFVSCTKTQKNEATEEAPIVANTEDLSKQDTIKITLNSNDKMQYDLSEIDVYEGQTVILTLHHKGTMPKAAMGHNFVLLTQGTEISKFANDAVKASDNDYIPTDKTNIIANTELIGGGETTEVTFNAPVKGTYDFLCSFPGHYSIMKGKFNVK